MQKEKITHKRENVVRREKERKEEGHMDAIEG